MIRHLLSGFVRRAAPAMSATEREALDAGDVWIDGPLFSGRPDLDALLAEPYPRLSAREAAFLDGPVEQVCAATDPAQVARDLDLSPEVWELLREHRFFGLGLPERWGGHGFSALAQSAIFGKLASRSMALSSVVLIPNSVGPGELLLEVGTEAQKEHYLPRLASGVEIPCFALTEPEAGSDAASLRSRAVAFRDATGQTMLRLDWDKRYITLAPIATLLGLAVRLEDPENLLGRGTEPGITCVLVPADSAGVELGRRHDPLGIPFPNGPTRGRGIVVSAEQIIGGPAYAGRGWRLLMEALSGGRAISLPAQSTAGVKYAARVAGAHAAVRQQFGQPIGRFEGIEEPLARLAGHAYLLEAARVFTCGAIDAGHRPSVVSAMVKYTSTEIGRARAADAMDIVGGGAICRGPRNLLADAWMAAPIGITVEGANILTRTLIVFGQGALRCHPHAHSLLDALRAGDVGGVLRRLVAQARHLASNGARALLAGATRGRLGTRSFSGRGRSRWERRALRRLGWASVRFAFWADIAMLAHGASLKRRGKLTGRLADVLSWQLLTLAALRRFQAEGRRRDDAVLARWAVQDGLARIQEGFQGVFDNCHFTGVARPLGWWVRGPVAALSRLNPIGRGPSDRLGARAARSLQRPDALRERLTGGLYLPSSEELRDPASPSPLATLEEALRLTWDSRDATRAIRTAIRRRILPKRAIDSLWVEAEAAGVVTAAERELAERAADARREATRVDDFDLETLRERVGRTGSCEMPHSTRPEPTEETTPCAVATP